LKKKITNIKTKLNIKNLPRQVTWYLAWHVKFF